MMFLLLSFYYHHPNQIPNPWIIPTGKNIAPAIRNPHITQQ